MLESPNSPASDASEGSQGRTWTLAASALFIVAIIVGALIAYLWPSDGGESDAAPTAPAPSTTAPQASDGSEAGFGTPRVDGAGRPVQVPSNPSGQVLPQSGGPAYTDRDPAWLTGAPRGLMWQAVNSGEVVPFSTSDGPTSLVNGVPKGFARTPQGAVLAAMQITARLGGESNAGRRRALIEQVTVSDGTPKAKAEREAMLDPSVAMTDLSSVGSNILKNIPIAMKVNEFDGSYALISYGGTPAPAPLQPGVAGMRADLQVVWRDGQWKVPFPLINSFAPQGSFAGWSTQW